MTRLRATSRFGSFGPPEAVRRAVLASLLVLTVTAAVLLVGRSGEDPAVRVAASARYGLLDEPGWHLKRAIHFRAGRGAFERTEPALEWVAEYDGPREDHADGSYTIPAVRVSGHALSRTELAERLPGFSFEPAEDQRPRVAVREGTESRPHLALIEWTTDSSVMLLSYDPVDLRRLAERVAPATEETWRAAGGRILDCVPPDRGCIVGE